MSIAPFRFFNQAAFGPGFLGPQYAPLIVGDQGLGFGGGRNGYEQKLKVGDLDLPDGIKLAQADARLGLLDDLEGDFLATHPGRPPSAIGRRTSGRCG